MKIRTIGDKLYKLTNSVSCYVAVDMLLNDKGIDCIAVCANELYDGTDKKMFSFGHKHHNKTVLKFWDDEFYYYAVGSFKNVKKIFDAELKSIEEDIENEKTT